MVGLHQLLCHVWHLLVRTLRQVHYSICYAFGIFMSSLRGAPGHHLRMLSLQQVESLFGSGHNLVGVIIRHGLR
jgi:hypothetical protein